MFSPTYFYRLNQMSKIVSLIYCDFYGNSSTSNFLIPIFPRIPARRSYATYTRLNYPHFFGILFVLTNIRLKHLPKNRLFVKQFAEWVFVLITTILTSSRLEPTVIDPICPHKLHFCFSRLYINLIQYTSNLSGCCAFY